MNLCGIALLALATICDAQYPPVAEYTSTLQSPLNSAISVAYNSPDSSVCATAFDTQKQYSGYIRLPPFTLAPVQQNYSINTFFWFIEARENASTAPLTIYLNGGPGSSSMFGLFNEVGPCTVVQAPNGSYTTVPNIYGWDRSSNIVFIDQPAQVGFSYDTLSNASLDLLTGELLDPSPKPAGQPGYTFLNGTFGSGELYATANTTQIAARATWHFLQTWLAAFPQYNPGVRPDNASVVEPTGINLFAESYGGQYGAVFANHFEEQNVLLAQGALPAATTLQMRLDSLGIVNGQIDTLIQAYYSPIFAYNNTYGIKTVSQVDQLNAISSYNSKCVPAIAECRAAQASTDPDGEGDVVSTAKMCSDAVMTCNAFQQTFVASKYSPYDIRLQPPSGTPSAAYIEYLNTATVQQAIGASVNYTDSSYTVFDAFMATGDAVSGNAITDLADLLRLGVRVAFMYGDADWICNWLGGEAISLALAALLPDFPGNSSSSIGQSPASNSRNVAVPPTSHLPSGNPGSYAAGFPRAGYADVVVNSTYVGGVVRQFGNLSFSRIYDSGHFVPYYQPETAFTLFTRIILGTDLSTGKEMPDLINSTFSSIGPLNSTLTQSAPSAKDAPEPTCWVRYIPGSCSDEDVSSVEEGEGIVRAGIWYADEDDYTPPPKSTKSSAPTNVANQKSDVDINTTAVTGVYTATATPSPTGAAMRVSFDSIGLGVVAAAAAAAGFMVVGFA